MGYIQTISKHRIFSRGSKLAALLLVLSLNVFSQEKKERKVYARICAGPVISFYQNNSFHTSGSRASYAFFVNGSAEYKIYKDFSLMPGLEYAHHGLSFNSYYLAPGYQFLYDGHYDYNYRLRIQEARLNLGVKQVIGIETRNIITGYTACAYVLRYLISSRMSVSSNLNGEELFNGKTRLNFEHPLFTRNTASAVKFIAGAQRNFFNSHRALFFEVAFTFSLSRFQVQESFTPSNLKINGSFLQIGLGGKF